jgi:glycerol-3-phosphate dehydrogenase
MLDSIEKDPSLAEPLIEATGIRRCEVPYLVEQEMIVKLEDYLRRRSKISLLMDRQKLRNAPGMRLLCEQLFGNQAVQRYDEYFATESGGGE